MKLKLQIIVFTLQILESVYILRSSCPEGFCEKGALRNF